MLRLLFLFFLPLTLPAQLKRFEFTENKMGAPFTLIFYCEDSVSANALSKESFALVDRFNSIFSDYSSTSEVGKLASMAVVKDQKVSDELFGLIQISKQAWIRSGKTFDITIGALTQLWRKAKKENRFPTPVEIKEAKDKTGFEKLIINGSTQTISFKKPGMSFDFGGIVPGYVAQKVMDLLKSKNIGNALVDASGDIVTGESPPGNAGWTVGINFPESRYEMLDEKLELKNFAVSTSGDVYRYIIHEGKRYSHIIDPKTGYGVTSQRNVTVINKHGADADWLATACSVLPIKKALALAKKEHAALFIATIENGNIITYKTKDFDKYFQKKQP
jgi:thiamine biosynthesis lipoprotein